MLQDVLIPKIAELGDSSKSTSETHSLKDTMVIHLMLPEESQVSLVGHQWPWCWLLRSPPIWLEMEQEEQNTVNLPCEVRLRGSATPNFRYISFLWPAVLFGDLLLHVCPSSKLRTRESSLTVISSTSPATRDNRNCGFTHSLCCEQGLFSFRHLYKIGVETTTGQSLSPRSLYPW